MRDIIRMTCDVAFCHPDNIIWNLSHPDEIDHARIPCGWLMANTGRLPDGLRCCNMSSGWHNVIWILSHPNDLPPVRISPGWLMAHLVCHPDDIGRYSKSSGWHDEIYVLANSLFHINKFAVTHADKITSRVSLPDFVLSSGRHRVISQVIWVIYRHKSFGWDTARS